MLRFLKNLSIRSKLFSLALLPLLGFLYFSGLQLIETYQEKEKLEEMKILTDSAAISALLVHELQKERGASAGFLGSKGEKFTNILNKQRAQTDDEINKLNNFINNTQLPVSLNKLFTQISFEINKLNSIRKRVSALTISVNEQVSFYSELNAQLLSIIDNAANHNSSPSLALSATSIGSFLQHKERAGIERAVMSNVFATGSFTPALLEKFIRILAEQDAYLAKFNAHATPEQKSIYQENVKGQSVTQVEQYRQLALNNMQTGNFGVDAAVWLSTITQKIDLLKKVEVVLLEEFSTTNQQLIANAYTHLVKLAALIAIAFCITITLSITIVWQLNQGINEITTKLQRIVESNDLTTRVDIKSNEELGHISNNINSLVSHLQNLVKDIQSNSNALSTSLSENAYHTNLISQKITTGSDQVTQVVTATTEMASTVAEIARSAIDASSETAQAVQESRQGGHDVDQTIENINKLSKELHNASEIIEQLNANSANIGKFLNVIKEISEKTNLLALNAAIEAARAGESGRGFAVVADEVRSLAMQTKNSTGEIQTMISELQASSAAAHMAMQSGIMMVGKSVQEAQHTGKSIRQINTRINHITEMNEQVATAAEEQSCVTEEINRNMVEIQDGYSDMSESYTQIEKGSLQLEQLSQQLNKAVAQFVIN